MVVKKDEKEKPDLIPFTRDKELNIHQRINKVMSEITYIKKGKTIKASREKGGGTLYNVTGHDAVTKLIHPLLVKHGINLVPSGETMIQEGNRTRIEMVFGWFNIDDPKDCINQKWFGYGIDPSDKGPGKAFSYAQRYIVLKTLHIETGDKDLEDDDIDFLEDDDIDFKGEKVIPHSKKVQSSVAGEDGDIPLGKAPAQTISAGAVKALENLFNKHNVDEAGKKKILDGFMVDSVEQILIKDYNAVKDSITN